MSQNSRNSLQKGIGGSYSVIGALALFGFGGYWLDRQRGNENFWLIIGLLFGVIVGMYELAKFIIRK